MSGHVYKIVEVVGSSNESSDDAIRNAISKASETISDIEWFQVVEQRGHVVNGDVGHFQIVLKVGFKLH